MPSCVVTVPCCTVLDTASFTIVCLPSCSFAAMEINGEIQSASAAATRQPSTSPAVSNPTPGAAATAASTITNENSPYRVLTIGEAVEGAKAGETGDDGEDGADEIEGLDEIKNSLCMSCGGNGTTRMLTTKIPFFREVILSSFECDDCQWRNNEVGHGQPCSAAKFANHPACSAVP